MSNNAVSIEHSPPSSFLAALQKPKVQIQLPTTKAAPVTAAAKFRRRIDLLAAPSGAECSNYDTCSIRATVKKPALTPVGPIRPKPAQYSFEASARKERAEKKAR